MNKGYLFYFKDGSDVLTFPITPSELSIKIGSNNKTITLINEGDINILKAPSLVEVEFEACFPMPKSQNYPFSREVKPFQEYWDKFKELKEKRKPFYFYVIRTTPNGKSTWDTELLVALESFEMVEDADNGNDVIISFKLKQYKEYGIKKLQNSSANGNTSDSTSTSDIERSTTGKDTKSSVYTVQSGDCFWNIAKAAYGDATRWKEIYEANKEAVEADARKHGRKDSENGHWIYVGLKLTIPGVDNAENLKVKKLW
jgi:hypothetical protein